MGLLFVTTLAAAPLAVGTLYFKPPGAFGCLIGYYFLAETWFAVLFTVIVEIVPPEECPVFGLAWFPDHFIFHIFAGFSAIVAQAEKRKYCQLKYKNCFCIA